MYYTLVVYIYTPPRYHATCGRTTLARVRIICTSYVYRAHGRIFTWTGARARNVYVSLPTLGGGARGLKSADWRARGDTHGTLGDVRVQREPYYQLCGAAADTFSCPSVAMPQPFGALLSPPPSPLRRTRVADSAAATAVACRRLCSSPSNSSSTNNNNNNNNASASNGPYRCRWLHRARSGQSHRRAHVRPARPSPLPPSSSSSPSSWSPSSRSSSSSSPSPPPPLSLLPSQSLFLFYRTVAAPRHAR